MPRAAKLKVFRMPVGFHDAYVAAASQKAAAEAWGTGTDVFSRGEAELVTDPELMEEPLASPGKVIKRLRGSAAEQIAALSPNEAKAPTKRKKASSPPAPRPSRDPLDKAEAALEDAAARHKAMLKELADREAALARERKALEAKLDTEMQRLKAARDKAEQSYRDAMRKWRESDE
jgi:hypothetical protein